jgi:hypothetical protein
VGGVVMEGIAFSRLVYSTVSLRATMRVYSQSIHEPSPSSYSPSKSYASTICRAREDVLTCIWVWRKLHAWTSSVVVSAYVEDVLCSYDQWMHGWG